MCTENCPSSTSSTRMRSRCQRSSVDICSEQSPTRAIPAAPRIVAVDASRPRRAGLSRSPRLAAELRPRTIDELSEGLEPSGGSAGPRRRRPLRSMFPPTHDHRGLTHAAAFGCPVAVWTTEGRAGCPRPRGAAALRGGMRRGRIFQRRCGISSGRLRSGVCIPQCLATAWPGLARVGRPRRARLAPDCGTADRAVNDKPAPEPLSQAAMEVLSSWHTSSRSRVPKSANIRATDSSRRMRHCSHGG